MSEIRVEKLEKILAFGFVCSTVADGSPSIANEIQSRSIDTRSVPFNSLHGLSFLFFFPMWTEKNSRTLTKKDKPEASQNIADNVEFLFHLNLRSI